MVRFRVRRALLVRIEVKSCMMLADSTASSPEEEEGRRRSEGFFAWVRRSHERGSEARTRPHSRIPTGWNASLAISALQERNDGVVITARRPGGGDGEMAASVAESAEEEPQPLPPWQVVHEFTPLLVCVKSRAHSRPASGAPMWDMTNYTRGIWRCAATAVFSCWGLSN